MELQKSLALYSGVNNCFTAPTFADLTHSDNDDTVLWYTASQHMEVSGGIDTSYSETSVLETQV